MIQVLIVAGIGLAAWIAEHAAHELRKHRETRWLVMSPHKRTAIRWVVILVTGLVILGLIKARMVTEIALAASGMALLIWIQRKLQSKVQRNAPLRRESNRFV